jgi:LPS sulfotransferase NodH
MEEGWSAFFARHGIQPHVIWYEDFIADYEDTVRNALAHLEIRLPESFVFPSPRLLKQGDDETENWVRKYGAAA